MRVSPHWYGPLELAYLAGLFGSIEASVIPMAVVDYLGMRDMEGVVTPEACLQRRFGVRDLRHVELYNFPVIALNRAGRLSPAGSRLIN